MSISPDDNGFWDVYGVTTDYLYAYLAWDLNLADLRQMVKNSLTYSSVEGEHKPHIE